MRLFPCHNRRSASHRRLTAAAEGVTTAGLEYPLSDATLLGSLPSPGAGVVLVRGEAFGHRGAHRIVEGAVLRVDLQALAAWDAADPLTRGPRPSLLPELQVLSSWEVR